MKKILSVLMLVAIAKSSPIGEDNQMGQWNRGYQSATPWYFPSGFPPPLSGPMFIPPGLGFLPPGHQQISPIHIYSTSCKVLEQAPKLQGNQPSSSLTKSCNIGWICQNPETGSMTITTSDGTQIITGSQQQPDNRSNQNGIHSNNENTTNNPT